MTDAQSTAAKRRHQRDIHHRCPLCVGSGSLAVPSVHTRAVSGGNGSHRVSLNIGQQSMTERGRKGGRPLELTLAELDARKASPVGGL